MQMLAMSSDVQFWVQTAMTVFTTIIGGVMTWVMIRIQESVRRYENLEKSSADQRDELEGELKTVATKLIEERFRHLSHTVTEEVQGMQRVMEEFKRQIRDDGGVLRELGKMDHSLEIKLLKEVSAIKEFVMERAASKQDLAEHQRSMKSEVNQLTEKLNQQNVQMARIEKQGTGTRDHRHEH
jgi:hypothetical protein